jgi:uncharacterized membrane protein YbhN (UPF0104 family)
MQMETKNDQRIKRDFAVRRTRQIIAIAAAVVLLLLFALLYKRPDMFWQISKQNLVIAQLLVILAFINFSAYNWICPSCKKYLGSDMNRKSCKKCGVRLR